MSPRSLATVLVSLMGVWFLLAGVQQLSALANILAIYGMNTSMAGLDESSPMPHVGTVLAGLGVPVVSAVLIGLGVILLRRPIAAWASAGDVHSVESRLTEGALARVGLLVLGVYLVARGAAMAVDGLTRLHAPTEFYAPAFGDYLPALAGVLMAGAGVAAFIASRSYLHDDGDDWVDDEPGWEEGVEVEASNEAETWDEDLV